MSDFTIPLLILTALGSGMMAGLFGAFSSFIMKSLAAIPAPGGISAMQSINAVIVRPSFLVIFFGTGATSIATVALGPQQLGEVAHSWALAGAATYLVGCLGITMVFNVPLNNRLARLDPDREDSSVLWSAYLSRWTRWNHLRALSTVASTGAFLIALSHAGPAC